jgi:hypothetical protein
MDRDSLFSSAIAHISVPLFFFAAKENLPPPLMRFPSNAR